MRIELLIALSIGIISCQTTKNIEINKDVSLDDIRRDLKIQDSGANNTTEDGNNVTSYGLGFNTHQQKELGNDADRVQEQLFKAVSGFNVRKGVVSYKYYPEMIYVAMTAVGRITDIALEPNEVVYSTPVIGNNIGWEIGSGKSGSLVGEIEHVYIKPDEVGLETNMIINTNKRVYRFMLRSNVNTYMPNIIFNYPEQEKVQQEVEEKRNENVKIDLNQINFGYSVVYTGKKYKMPFWAPNRVFDDGSKTFIYVPGITKISSLPVIFSKHGNGTEVVNYRIRGAYIISDGLFDEFVMVEDVDKPDEVRISRTTIK